MRGRRQSQQLYRISERRPTLTQYIDHKQIGITEKDRRCNKILLALLMILFSMYLCAYGLLMYYYINFRDDLEDDFVEESNWYVYLLVMSTIALVKYVQLCLACYEYSLWSNVKVNALNKALICRLRTKFFLTWCEAICFIDVIIIYFKSKGVYESINEKIKEVYEQEGNFVVYFLFVALVIYCVNQTIYLTYQFFMLIFFLGAYCFLAAEGGNKFSKPKVEPMAMYEE